MKTNAAAKTDSNPKIDWRAIDDGALLDRLLASDNAAWKELMRRFGPKIKSAVGHVAKRFSGKLLSREHDDIMGEFYLSLLEDDMRKLRVFDPAKGRSLGSWLCMLAYQRAMDHVRKFKKIPKHVSLDALLEQEARDLDDITDEELRIALRDPFATRLEALAMVDGSEHPLAARVVACGRKVGA